MKAKHELALRRWQAWHRLDRIIQSSQARDRHEGREPGGVWLPAELVNFLQGEIARQPGGGSHVHDRFRRLCIAIEAAEMKSEGVEEKATAIDTTLAVRWGVEESTVKRARADHPTAEGAYRILDGMPPE